MLTIAAALQSRSYPGRGFLAARAADGSRCLIYFLTGRSPSSRARKLAVLEGGDIAVQGNEPGGQFDPLRHYVAGARRAPWIVVGNGAQVVPIAESLAAGTDVLEVWRAHGYEPDAPIFTPRIWVASTAGSGECLIGYALRSGRGGDGADRVVWSVEDLRPGEGVLMTTYDGTPAQVHNARVPVDVQSAGASAAELLDEIWAALAPELRVAAFAIDPDGAGPSLQVRP